MNCTPLEFLLHIWQVLELQEWTSTVGSIADVDVDDELVIVMPSWERDGACMLLTWCTIRRWFPFASSYDFSNDSFVWLFACCRSWVSAVSSDSVPWTTTPGTSLGFLAGFVLVTDFLSVSSCRFISSSCRAFRLKQHARRATRLGIVNELSLVSRRWLFTFLPFSSSSSKQWQACDYKYALFLLDGLGLFVVCFSLFLLNLWEGCLSPVWKANRNSIYVFRH